MINTKTFVALIAIVVMVSLASVIIGTTTQFADAQKQQVSKDAIEQDEKREYLDFGNKISRVNPDIVRVTPQLQVPDRNEIAQLCAIKKIPVTPEDILSLCQVLSGEAYTDRETRQLFNEKVINLIQDDSFFTLEELVVFGEICPARDLNQDVSRALAEEIKDRLRAIP